MYKTVKDLGREPFQSDANKALEQAFTAAPPFDFLALPAVQSTTPPAPQAAWLEPEVQFLKTALAPWFKRAIHEDPIGKPKIIDVSGVKTSADTIHSLYQMYRFAAETDTKIDDFKTVIEWGGGYGNFAKLWHRQTYGKSTYIIVDTAAAVSLQWLYLCSVLSQEVVHLLEKPNDGIQPNKINLMPLSLLKNIDIQGDLFIALGTLGNGSQKAKEIVEQKQWFGAKRLFVNFQDDAGHTAADGLGELALQAGAKKIAVPFGPSDHYAVK